MTITLTLALDVPVRPMELKGIIICQKSCHKETLKADFAAISNSHASLAFCHSSILLRLNMGYSLGRKIFDPSAPDAGEGEEWHKVFFICKEEREVTVVASDNGMIFFVGLNCGKSKEGWALTVAIKAEFTKKMTSLQSLKVVQGGDWPPQTLWSLGSNPSHPLYLPSNSAVLNKSFVHIGPLTLNNSHIEILWCCWTDNPVLRVGKERILYKKIPDILTHAILNGPSPNYDIKYQNISQNWGSSAPQLK